MNEDYLVSLLVRKWSGELDSKGMQELERWAEEDPMHRQLLERISNEATLAKELDIWRQIDPSEAYARWLSAVGGGARIISIRRRRRVIVAAAAVGLLVGIGGLLWQRHPVGKPNINPVVSLPMQDLKPGGNKAILTLSGGAKIELDGAKRGTIAKERGSNIQKLADGEIAYAATASKSGEVLYNTITTPPGGQYEVTLSDGTKVWLNAASSMRYPIAFKGSSRRVEITGEAYFEVAHDGVKPFYVSVRGMDVEVLGTNFNINGYDDEPSMKTTLLEGRVKVKEGNATLLLAPGDAANLEGEKLSIAHNVDVEQAVAWKNGYFQFNGSDIQTVMRTLARWYNVKVVYEGEIPKVHSSGSISRNNNASVVMKVLQESGFHFRIENTTIVVMP